MKNIIATILTILLVIAIFFGALCLEAWIIMLLWNWVIVSLFNAPTIGFWLAFGIMCVLSIIGGFFKTTVHKD